jgi:hypothetical protein
MRMRLFRLTIFGVLAVILLSLVGCRANKSVVLERVVHKTDTLYKTNLRVDSFRILDSVFVETFVRGDTVYKTNNVYKWRDRISYKTDTIFQFILRSDSTQVPVPVERRQTWWERYKLSFDIVFYSVIISVIIKLLIWLIHRRQ